MKIANHKYLGKKILLLEGYCRQSLPFLKAFKDLGCETTILCNSKWDCAYWSRLPDHKIQGICDWDRPKETEQYIVELIKRGNYDMVVPLFDFSAEILAHNKIELSKYAVIMVNDKEPFDKAHDKLNVMKTCLDLGIPHPFTLQDVKSMEDIRKSGITFPVFIKPRDGAGAKGCHIYKTLEDMDFDVKKVGIDIGNYVVQECIPIDSLLVSSTVFVDDNGEIKSSYQYGSYRFFPLSGGTGTLNVTLNREDIHKISEKLVRALNLRGSVSLDLMIDSRNDVAKVLEINPRVLACSKIGFVAGVNQARQMLEAAWGDEVSSQMSYLSDIRVRMMQTDLLWFLKSPVRFRSNPSWFSWKNTTEQTFCWSDPLPWFAFLIRGLINFRSDIKKRS